MHKLTHDHLMRHPRLKGEAVHNEQSSTQIVNVSWRHDRLELSHFNCNSEGSSVVDLTVLQP